MKLENGKEVDIKSDRYGKKQVMIMHTQKTYVNLTVSTVEKLTSLMKKLVKLLQHLLSVKPEKPVNQKN